MTDTAVEAPLWRIEWQGAEWTSADLTGEHIAVIAELLDVAPSWQWLNAADLHPALGPLQLMSLIAAFVIVDEGVQGNAARRRVLEALKDSTADDLLAALHI